MAVSPKEPRRARRTHPPLRSFGIAMLGGVLYFLGFAGFGLWPFAFVALVPLLAVLEKEVDRPVRHALEIGFAYGFVEFWGGYYWLVEMLRSFSGFSALPSIAFAAIYVAYLTLQQVIFAGLYVRARANGWSPTAALIVIASAIELLFPSLFPAYISNGFHALPWLVQIADLGGPVLVSMVAFAVNGALFETLSALLDRRRPARRTPAIALAALVLTIGYGAYRTNEVDRRAAAAPTLRVGVVQVNMGLFDKRDDPIEGHQRHLEQTRELERDASPDLVVWPESAFGFFLPRGTTNVSRYVLEGLHTPVLFGGLARRGRDDDFRAYNTAYLTNADGDILGTYDKTFLLAFGEYLPFGETFPILYDWSPNSGHFTPGSHVRPLVLDETRISTLICYEDVLPSFVREAVREGNPHFLVNVTNDAWFGDTHEPWVHLALAKMRAVEHHRTLVRATNSGVSAIVDPVGRVVRHGGVMTRETFHADVPLLDGHTLYEHIGDVPGWIAVGLTLLFALRKRRAAATA